MQVSHVIMGSDSVNKHRYNCESSVEDDTCFEELRPFDKEWLLKDSEGIGTEISLPRIDAQTSLIALNRFGGKVETTEQPRSDIPISPPSTEEYTGCETALDLRTISMGSSISVKRLQKPKTAPSRSRMQIKPEGTASPPVEICAVPGLEEAEGISHAKELTKLSSEFDGDIQIDSESTEDFPLNFSNILEEFISNEKRASNAKGQPPRFGQPRKASQNTNTLNLTLTGLKAKRVERSPTLTTRALTSRSTRRRISNPNVMKSMEDRLASSAGATTKGRANYLSQISDKKSAGKAYTPRPVKKVCLLAAIKPSNLDSEKEKFFASNFAVNPQFEYRYATNESVLARYNNASSLYVEEVRLFF